MNYQKIYDQIIERAKNRTLDGYSETHHIIPRSEGGSDNPENLVDLTAREHFLCHVLLYKIQPSISRINAIWMMLRESEGQYRHFPNSRVYEIVKEKRNEYMSELQIGRKHIYNPETGDKRFVKGDELKILLSRGWVFGSPKKSPTKGKIGIHLPGTRTKKYVDPEDLKEYIKEGWVEGLFSFESSHKWNGKRSGKANPTYGKKAIHNPSTGDRKYVDPSEIDEYLDNGYKLGRGKNKI